MPSSDPAALRAAAEAQVARLRGPLWSGDGVAECGAVTGDVPSSTDDEADPPTADPGSGPARRRRSPDRPASTRPAGRPAFETDRLPRREVRIPVVVDERAREVAAWGGIEPTDAIWLLASLGWDSWRRDHVEVA